MRFYWETHKKFFDGVRLAWHGDAADPDFWSTYWKERLTRAHYDQLVNRKLSGSPVGQVLLREIKPTDKIIEAGCGIGNWVALLEHYGYGDVEGIEYSSEVVEMVNQANPLLAVRCGDALDIQSEDNSYDVYLSFGVIEHRIEGPEPFLREACRVLKPGGKAIITVPTVGPLRTVKAKMGFYRDEIQGHPFFQFGFSKNILCRLIEENGLTPLYCKYLETDRLWMEEVKAYRFLAKYNLFRGFEKFTSRCLEGIDGHMILVTAIKQ